MFERVEVCPQQFRVKSAARMFWKANVQQDMRGSSRPRQKQISFTACTITLMPGVRQAGQVETSLARSI